jgi:cytochrome c peroxidase
MHRTSAGLLGVFAAVGLLTIGSFSLILRGQASKEDDVPGHDHALPNPAWMAPFKDQAPIVFVNQNMPEWKGLKELWNEATETAVDPSTGDTITRRVVKIKVPLGLTSNPPVPPENPMTVAKWALGKKLYYDEVLSSDSSVSCATCHDPGKGFTDQAPVSTGIKGQKGGMSAPTVYNAAYSPLQFWDGRAFSLEDQSQGPPQNPVEMFDGEGHAWKHVIRRLRANKEYVAEFKKVFGTLPTRDAVAKAIATYERTVLTGGSIHDRAVVNAVERAMDEGKADFTPLTADYARALKDAFAIKDTAALEALELKNQKDAAEFAKRLANGRNLFFNKARCSGCHVGDNFTDGGFHNLGVGLKDGKVPASQAGRYGAQPTGHKSPEMYGAFKTPPLRQLLSTAPYMHDGSEKDLMAVVDFYDKGGNPNPYLDIRMRDEDAEKAWYAARAAGKEYKGPEAFVYDGKVIVPLKLKLTAEEKKDLVLFMRALQGEPAPKIITDRKAFPK